jgi:4-aminobutyrate aminotransferase-like enzyme
MKFNRFWKNGKTFGFQNYDVVPDIVVMGKEWVEECLWALYRINRNDGFIE